MGEPTGAPGDEGFHALDALGRDFWAWRAVHQPFTGDDIPRIDRPAEWAPDWSPASIAAQRAALAAFERRWRALDPSDWPIPRQVDYLLVGSALARGRWELEILRTWQRNPLFYLDQTLGAVFDRLLQPPPFDRTRGEEIVRRLESIPRTLQDARANLVGHAVAPFARLALERLAEAPTRLRAALRALAPYLPSESAARLGPAGEAASEALEGFRAWLAEQLPTLVDGTAIGRDAYAFFLTHVALMPFTPEQLLARGRQEWERAVAFEAYEQQRNAGLPPLALLLDQEAEMRREAEDELAVRRFCEARDLLTFPAWLRHYRFRPLPPYLEPLAFLGVTDDLTSPTRLDQDGTSYIAPPSPTLGYFALANARDPRTGIAHEGMHYFQLALSWAHENPLRRHYYDSGANEGIGFYAEEMLLQAGLFDDSPRTREIIYSFMRLRALRVEVDVRLALGSFDLDEAARELATMVPMDWETAHHEAVFFASSPGQAMTYQIGKLQLLKFLADARLAQGDGFRLRAFHDFVWKNGNVPIALQRWEWLGLRDEIDTLDRLASGGSERHA